MTKLTPERMRNFVQANPDLVTCKPQPNGLHLLKYTRKVFYGDLWTPELEACRGTIVDDDFNVVLRPFNKIYNYSIESSAPKLDNDTLITAYRKVNGFMAAMTWYKDDILISTTGSTSSDFVQYVKDMVAYHKRTDWRAMVRQNAGFTLLFECVHPDDPHIVPEDQGLYLLAACQNSWDYRLMAPAVSEYHSLYILGSQMTMRDLKLRAKNVWHEGFVFYTDDGVSAKIKSPYYLVSKLFARKMKIADLMKSDIKHRIDEEYYPLVDHIKANLAQFEALSEQNRLAFIRSFYERS